MKSWELSSATPEILRREIGRLQSENTKLRAALERCVTELAYIIEAPTAALCFTAETEVAWEQGSKALKGE